MLRAFKQEFTFSNDRDSCWAEFNWHFVSLSNGGLNLFPNLLGLVNLFSTCQQSSKSSLFGPEANERQLLNSGWRALPFYLLFDWHIMHVNKLFRPISQSQSNTNASLYLSWTATEKRSRILFISLFANGTDSALLSLWSAAGDTYYPTIMNCNIHPAILHI